MLSCSLSFTRPFRRECLLKGLDDIGLTLGYTSLSRARPASPSQPTASHNMRSRRRNHCQSSTIGPECGSSSTAPRRSGRFPLRSKAHGSGLHQNASEFARGPGRNTTRIQAAQILAAMSAQLFHPMGGRTLPPRRPFGPGENKSSRRLGALHVRTHTTRNVGFLKSLHKPASF